MVNGTWAIIRLSYNHTNKQMIEQANEDKKIKNTRHAVGNEMAKTSERPNERARATAKV